MTRLIDMVCMYVYMRGFGAYVRRRTRLANASVVYDAARRDNGMVN
jgi:hypothetical protein